MADAGLSEVAPGAVQDADASEVVPASLRVYWLLNATHALVDVLPMVITSLMIVLQDRLALTRGQETAVWVITPIFSGLCQPFFAWAGDRYDTRLAGPVGLALGAVCIGSIGFAQTFSQLIALQIVGVIGIGMYHPAAAAVAGQLGSRAIRRGRGLALGLFVASGMVGHTIGPIVSTRVNEWLGIGYLAWLIPPALLAAVGLHVALRHTPHRHHDHHALRAALAPAEARARWLAAGLLSAQNALRFTVNTGMFILFNYWASARVPGDPDAAAVLNGNLTAATTIGMGAGALLSHRLVRPGAERGALAATAFGGALCVASINAAADWGLRELGGGAAAMFPAYLMAGLAAVGFFTAVPASLGLGQRLLPSHTSVVTAMLLGLAWMVGASARPISSTLLGGIRLDQAHTLPGGTLDRAFFAFALLLALAGVLALVMPRRTIRAAATLR